jgi:heme A synthase
MNKWLKSAIKAPIILFCIAPIWLFLSTTGVRVGKNLANINPSSIHLFIEWVNYIYWIALIISLLNLFYQLVKSDLRWKRKLFFASPRLFLILMVFLWVYFSFSDFSESDEALISWIVSLLAISFMIMTWIEARKKESVEKKPLKKIVI